MGDQQQTPLQVGDRLPLRPWRLAGFGFQGFSDDAECGAPDGAQSQTATGVG